MSASRCTARSAFTALPCVLFARGSLLLTISDGGLAAGHAQVGTRRFRLDGPVNTMRVTEIDMDAFPPEDCEVRFTSRAITLSEADPSWEGGGFNFFDKNIFVRFAREIFYPSCFGV